MRQKSLAFTLGEVLIALTVIGVIATMVLPPVILGQKTNKSKAAFNTAFSILSSTISTMDSNNISLKPVTYIGTPTKFYTELKKYMKVNYDCGAASLCRPKPAYSDIHSSGAFILNNGMLVVVEKVEVPSEDQDTNKEETSAAGTGGAEESSSDENKKYALIVSVDVNGNTKNPNRRGVDIFSFELINGDIVPVGAQNSSFPGVQCDYTPGAQTISAMACTQDAATDDEYFKKMYNNS